VAEETAGPFPANGSNANAGINKNVLTDSRVFRTDIRADLDGSNVQTGIPLTLTMTLLNVNGSCAPLAGVFVYLWHCNRTGSYSQYSGNNNGGDFSERSWLRGVAQTDPNGQVTFTTIFPGRYAGRATHMHFQVFPDATPANGEQRATSQLAFPASVTDSSTGPYSNTTLYPSSAANNTTNENDGVFRDGTSTEMLSISGNNSSGYTATITVAVAA
jgi:protocatechuate 3,4-dioxygenase beta subunit